MKRKLLLVAMTTLVAFGLIAPAANADITGAGTLVGTAQVGRHFLDDPTAADAGEIDCNKDTVKDVYARGQGLYLPSTDPTVAKNGVWSLHIPTVTLVTTGGASIAGTLDACGFLMHTLRNELAQGPACGISKGHSGLGQVNFAGINAGGLNLFDLQWKPTSAGGVLPVFGKYQVWNGSKPDKEKKNKWGNILAQVVAIGGLPCLDPKNCPNQKTARPGTAGCGAQTFTVAGTFELIQLGDGSKDSVIRPNDLPLMCKDSSAPKTECLFDTKKGNGKETPKDKPTG